MSRKAVKPKQSLPKQQAGLVPVQSVAVIGAGAVGAFYGSMLQRHGLSVEYQSAMMAKAKVRTLTVNSVWSDYKLPVSCFARSELMQPADLVIVSLKVLPSIDPFSLVTPVLKKKSIILLLQNGINEEERYTSYYKKTHFRPILLGGLAFTCINRINAHQISHIDYGRINIAAQKTEHRTFARQVTRLFQEAGITTDYLPDLRRARFEKLLWNVPYNSLSVLLNTMADQIVENPHTLSLSVQMMKELQAIAKAEGINLPAAMLDRMVKHTQNMKPYKTSMLLDYEAGRPMEIDSILGQPLILAKRAKVAAPAIQMAYDMLHFYEHSLQ